MITPSNSVYNKALESKEVAASILLPLIEFEFAFHGAQKPAITQSESNLCQLNKIFQICNKHGWISSKINKLGNKNEYWFKLSNSGFKEIYEIAGPMADKNKDKWAILLCECANKKTKDRKSKDKICNIVKNNEDISIKEICLKTRLLPYTVSRHVRKLKKEKRL